MNYPWVDAYLLQKQGVTKDFKEEWGWHRYMIGGKLFCAVCLGDDGKEVYITLKLDPFRGDSMRQLYPEDIIPGYYMNKTHWNSVKADGCVPDALLRDLLDEAYQLVLSGLSRKKQQEISVSKNSF